MKTSKQILEDAKRQLLEGKVTESIESFSKAIDGGEKTDVSYLSRGVAYLRNREPEKAISDFSEVVKRNDRNARAHYYRGIAYMTREDYKGAITDFDKTIELDPENAAAFFARGTAYANIGNDDLATKNMKTAITFSESDIYGLQESIGLLRTEFDKTMSIMGGLKEPGGMVLAEDEVGKLKTWLGEKYAPGNKKKSE